MTVTQCADVETSLAYMARPRRESVPTRGGRYGSHLRNAVYRVNAFNATYLGCHRDSITSCDLARLECFRSLQHAAGGAQNLNTLDCSLVESVTVATPMGPMGV